MGIRYYAYPVDAELLEIAKTSPRSFLGDDPLMDAWGPIDEKPHMLYLDKCWRDLQMLFSGDGTSPARSASALVKGQVTHTNGGWIAYEAVLDPAQVSEIALDLATISPTEVRSVLTAQRTLGLNDDFEKEIEYVTHYLRGALAFTKGLSELGNGLVYTIG
jgi:hypothetical protein